MTNLHFMIVSFILLIISLCLYKKPVHRKFTIFFYFIGIFSSLFLYITYGVSDYLSGNGIDEATIYHMRYGLGGAGFGEYKELITIALSLLFLEILFLIWFFLIKKHNYKRKNHIAYILLLLSLTINPASMDIVKVFSVDYGQGKEFYKFYRKPHIEKIAEKTKNLVFIYAESLERTYFKRKIFPGLIKHLRKFNAHTVSFNNIVQTPGNGYTIGGMVCSQLGIPLVTPSFVNSMSGMDKFLPSAIGLGDLLKTEGYHLAFYGGAHLSFAGKGKFFKTHGFDEVLGLNELLPRLKDKSYRNGWGLYDDTLFDIVFDRFVELSKAEKPFGLFTLTLDTHHPNGQPSKSCGFKYKDGSNPILNAVKCSDYLIKKFIDRIIASPYAKDTIIVLVSDHIALKNSAFDLLHKWIRIKLKGKYVKKRLPRRNLFMIIDPNGNLFENTNIFGSNLDIAPTILPFIGYKGEIGLGHDLLEKKNNKTRVKLYAIRKRKELRLRRKKQTYILKHFKYWKGEIVKFWNFPRIRDSINIDIDNNSIKLDDREFKLPILIELNDKLITTLKFQFDINNKKDNIPSYIKKNDKTKYFLTVAKGKVLKSILYQVNEDKYYIAGGKGNTINFIKKLDENKKFSKTEISKLLGI